jgi:hypothetical protein
MPGDREALPPRLRWVAEFLRVTSRVLARAAAWQILSRVAELRITRVSRCVARGFRARASFMFAGCCWWRSLAVDGSPGASQGHASVVRRPSFRWASPSNDRPFFRPDISPVVTDRVCVLRCRRPLALAVGCCCCCHRCCQPSADRPVESRPVPCRGWPASGPGRLPPGPCLLAGVSVEAPGSSLTSRVRSPGTFHLCSLSCGHSHA